ncbi:MAG TPA: hypothetical protein VM076_09800 [Gemmatimonadaceae bacterium]|nr:hypothetical protein [Gemmatimonadaceae bacterium]
MQSNRPESGGADPNEQQEKSGLLEREKQEFAKADKEKHDARASKQGSDRGTADEGEPGE